jgi:hypothetical protein
VSLPKARKRVEEMMNVTPLSHVASARLRDVWSATPANSWPFTPRANLVFELSHREALQLGHQEIDTEHLLLGLVREGDGFAARVLVSLGVDLNAVHKQVMGVLDDNRGSEPRGRLITRNVIRRPRPLDLQKDTFAERVGNEWNARVVRAGRTPPAYEAAYEELKDMLESVGIAVGDPGVTGITVSSIDTNGGPGLALSISHRVEVEPDREVDDQDSGEMP